MSADACPRCALKQEALTDLADELERFLPEVLAYRTLAFALARDAVSAEEEPALRAEIAQASAFLLGLGACEDRPAFGAGELDALRALASPVPGWAACFDVRLTRDGATYRAEVRMADPEKEGATLFLGHAIGRAPARAAIRAVGVALCRLGAFPEASRELPSRLLRLFGLPEAPLVDSAEGAGDAQRSAP